MIDVVGVSGARSAGNREVAPLLEVRELEVRFGGITALRDCSLTIDRGQIVGLIGPNGAGKTTLFNCLSRLCRPTAGEILFEGRSILKTPRHRIAGLGLGRTFQNVALFDKMSVEDNVLVGGHVQGHGGWLGEAFKPKVVRDSEEGLRRRADELIGFMALDRWRWQKAGGLPFPIRKRVELARALMAHPKLMLLDEPAAGLNHQEVQNLRGQIEAVRTRFDVTVLLVEHHMNLVMSVSDKIVVLDFGRKIADGTPAEVQREPLVIQAYLGMDGE